MIETVVISIVCLTGLTALMIRDKMDDADHEAAIEEMWNGNDSRLRKRWGLPPKGEDE